MKSLIEGNPEALHPVTRAIIESARKFDAVAAFEAFYRLADQKRKTSRVWSEFDAMLVPTAPRPYTIARGDMDRQGITVTVDGPPPAATAAGGRGAVKARLGGSAGLMPDLAVCADDSPSVATSLPFAELAQRQIVRLDPSGRLAAPPVSGLPVAVDRPEAEVRPAAFEQVAWVLPRELSGYDFLAANRELVANLATGRIKPGEILVQGESK